ncbi:MAG: 4-hydroxy-tetrahydrodipicolinate synthase [Myxococcota bacterium]|jgi:4-hydroxy-tetrahydrodipicolinate synthase
MTFHGVLTALVTPFTADGQVDEAAFRAHVRRQLDAGIAGLVPCGTTGEAPTLTVDEQVEVVRWTVEESSGRVPILAGIGSNDTRTAIDTALRVQELGVQGVLGTTPYYNKPTQQGLVRHFTAIADAIDIELCLYDVPGRTALAMQPKTTARLSAHPRITCVKDATGDLNVATELRRSCTRGFTLLSGDDFTTLPFLAVGGQGCISVASNIVPERTVAMVADALAGRTGRARDAHLALFPLWRVLFVQTNPLPVKTAMAAMDWCEETFRLPLCPMDAEPRAALLAEVERQGLLRSA